MLKKLVLMLIAFGIVAGAKPAGAETPLLSPVDPLAWAVVNTDWGHMGGKQLTELRKVVNGQVRAHEVNNSRTDPRTGVVQRLKCFDPANCVMCSTSAMDYGKRMRDQLRASSGAIQGNTSSLAALATYYEQQTQAQKDRERLNADSKDFVMSETRIVDGQEVTTTKTVTFENPGNEGAARAQQLAQQMQKQLAMQTQQQGLAVYAYIEAATKTLKTPKPAIALNVSSDPLNTPAAPAKRGTKAGAGAAAGEMGTNGVTDAPAGIMGMP